MTLFLKHCRNQDQLSFLSPSVTLTRLSNIQHIGAAITANGYIVISALTWPLINNYKYEKSRYCTFTVTCGQLQLHSSLANYRDVRLNNSYQKKHALLEAFT